VRRGITPATTSGRRTEVLSVVDRAEAIERAVTMAGSGDLILIAGKGHEKYQQIGDRVLPFDDAAVAREALARRQARRTKAL
jgi:UDP-N-acetylmuramoyl-L-alanyl-D-glutamate--2,6-diaminopimelate ligase